MSVVKNHNSWYCTSFLSDIRITPSSNTLSLRLQLFTVSRTQRFKAKNENNLPTQKKKKKKKKKRIAQQFPTLVLIVNSARNTASWLAKIGDTILALVGSQVIVPALWLAQTKVSRETTPYITLLQHERKFFYLQQYFAQYYNAATLHSLLARSLAIMLHTLFSFSFVENHFVVKIDRKMTPLFLVLLSLLAVGHATSKFNRRNV